MDQFFNNKVFPTGEIHVSTLTRAAVLPGVIYLIISFRFIIRSDFSQQKYALNKRRAKNTSIFAKIC